MVTRGVVRLWTEDGWGDIDSPQTPGGCWALWVHVMVPGVRKLASGQQVELEWEVPGHDGYDHRECARGLSGRSQSTTASSPTARSPPTAAPTGCSPKANASP